MPQTSPFSIRAGQALTYVPRSLHCPTTIIRWLERDPDRPDRFRLAVWPNGKTEMDGRFIRTKADFFALVDILANCSGLAYDVYESVNCPRSFLPYVIFKNQRETVR